MLDIFLGCLVLLSFLIFKSGEFKTLIGISDTMKGVSYLWALLYDDLAELFSCEDPAISIFRAFTLCWSNSAETHPPFTFEETKDGC